MTDAELARVALDHTDEVEAWLGSIKADKTTVSKVPAGTRWDFSWIFKKEVVLEALEVIVRHELLTLDADHAWIRCTMDKGETFSHVLVIDKEGHVK